MDQAFRTAFVYVRDSYAGTLQETDEGYVFQYDAQYLSDPNAPAVSLTLPRQEAPFLSKTLFAFFDGLIPEGWLLNLVIGRSISETALAFFWQPARTASVR